VLKASRKNSRKGEEVRKAIAETQSRISLRKCLLRTGIEDIFAGRTGGDLGQKATNRKRRENNQELGAIVGNEKGRWGLC